MQTKKAECKQINARSDRFIHRIGSTTYTVSIYPKEGQPEKLEDKILRLINSELESDAGGAENYSGNAISLLKGGLTKRLRLVTLLLWGNSGQPKSRVVIKRLR